MGAHTSLVGVFVLVTCFGMLIFAGWLAQWVMAKDEGTVDMQEVKLSFHCKSNAVGGCCHVYARPPIYCSNMVSPFYT